ncbi:MAG TPA: DUF2380 domain-containing protein [Myxococcota bacterium]
MLALLVASADPAGAVVIQKPKVLVLDFKDDGVGEQAVRVIRDTLVAHLSQDARLDVISSEDMRRTLDVDAQKRQLGNCNDEGCQAEIAEALGAQLTIYGTAGKLGELVVVNVSLFDARAGKSVGRETIEVKALDDLPGPLRATGDKLVARVPGIATAPAPGIGTLTIVGAVVGVVGLGTAVTCGIIALANNPSPGDGRTFKQKQDAVGARDLNVGIAAVGAGVVVVGAVVAAVGLATE